MHFVVNSCRHFHWKVRDLHFWRSSPPLLNRLAVSFFFFEKPPFGFRKVRQKFLTLLSLLHVMPSPPCKVPKWSKGLRAAIVVCSSVDFFWQVPPSSLYQACLNLFFSMKSRSDDQFWLAKRSTVDAPTRRFMTANASNDIAISALPARRPNKKIPPYGRSVLSRNGGL